MNKLQRFYRKAKAPQLLAGLLLTMSFLSGCASSQPSPSPYMLPGAGVGAALGAGIGAAANHNNPWKGAAIGGLLGAAGGAVAGEAYGRSRVPDQPQAYYPQSQQQTGYYQPQYQPPQQQGYYEPQYQGYGPQQPY